VTNVGERPRPKGIDLLNAASFVCFPLGIAATHGAPLRFALVAGLLAMAPLRLAVYLMTVISRQWLGRVPYLGVQCASVLIALLALIYFLKLAYSVPDPDTAQHLAPYLGPFALMFVVLVLSASIALVAFVVEFFETSPASGKPEE
jgi:hypothetical protein